MIDGNAAAVVDDGDAVIDMYGDFDGVTVAGERFIDGIVDDFIHQVMQTPLAGIADVHAGALSDRFQALQNFYVIRAVFGILLDFLVQPFSPRAELEFFLKVLDLGSFYNLDNSTGNGAKSKAIQSSKRLNL